jgi:hypothetical protein
VLSVAQQSRNTLNTNGAAATESKCWQRFDSALSGYAQRERGFGGILYIAKERRITHNDGDDTCAYFSPNGDPHLAAKMMVEHFRKDKVFGLHTSVREQFTWERIYATKIAPLLG